MQLINFYFMKNLILLCIFCIFNNVALSKDITISFSAKSDTIAIDSIQVLNLRTNQTVKLSGHQNLILVNTSTNLDVLPLVNNNLKVYPNPAWEYANLTFSLPESQDVVINLNNISGQLILCQTHSLHTGKHQFKVKFPVSGLYHLSVGTENGLLNSKVLFYGDKTGSSEMEYIGSDALKVSNNQLKSATSGLENNTLEFKPGDIIHYTVYSGEDITLISDTPNESISYEVEIFKCTDSDGKNYKTVKIGQQVWMAENLAWLPSVSPPLQGSNTEYYYYVYGYEGTSVSVAKDTDNYKTYGVLYNWPAAMAGAASSSANPSGVQGVCPAGWHIPSDAEWTQLENYLIANGYNYDGTISGYKFAKSMAATSNWNAHTGIGNIGNNLSLNNKSGFSALPGGRRHDGGFLASEDIGYWWISTMTSVGFAWHRSLQYNSGSIGSSGYRNDYGFSVRCVRD